jgi:CCR4-NOT transcription complex subunit 3
VKGNLLTAAQETKRIHEGVGAFQGVHDKLVQSQNASQKEKLEDALKKEIKKLQRSRDKVKAWIGSNEVKDKRHLLDMRRLIETVRSLGVAGALI